MLFTSGQHPAFASSELEDNFKGSMHALSSAVVSIVTLLNLPATHVSPTALGLRLTEFLGHLRTHRNHAAALGAKLEDPKDLVQYLHGLAQLRATVAHWHTVHAARPKLIFVSIEEFEAQCWSTLGIGMVVLDAIRPESYSLHSALTTRFHDWWSRLNTKPAMFPG
jgi:hypothetical protein